MARVTVPTTLVVLIAAALLSEHAAFAFKLKTHLIVANQALNAIRDETYEANGGIYYKKVANLTDVFIGNTPDTVNLVRRLRDNSTRTHYRNLFRGGVLGPDCFPDLFGGQLWVHVNKGKAYDCDTKWNATACTSSNTTFEARKFDQWRSIDYGMYQLREAKKIVDDEERLQALAFCYGYMSHMIGDGFAHGIVNEWTKAPFEYTTGSGLYGPITEEIKHLAVEGFLDWSMPETPQSELEIEIPIDFLNNLYASFIPTTNASGEFAGIYFVKLLEAINLMDDLSNGANWPKYAPAYASEIKAFNSYFDDDSILGFILKYIGNVGNLKKDIEGIFLTRKTMLIAILNEWVHLSRCVAQNIVWGSNVDFLGTDSCQSHDFESNADVKRLMKIDSKAPFGLLNEAAYYGRKLNNTNYGLTSISVGKIRSFVETMANRFVQVVATDIASIKTMKDAIVAECDGAIVFKYLCDKIMGFFDLIDRLMKWLHDTYVAPLFEEMKRALLEQYAGPYADDFLNLWDEFEDANGNDKPLFKVNTAFLPEDLVIKPGYSMEVLAALSGNPSDKFNAAVGNRTSPEAIANATYALAQNNLNSTLKTSDDKCMRQVWTGLVVGLDSVSKGADLSNVDKDSRYNWLDCYTPAVNGDAETYHTRLARFIALLRALRGLHSLVGPTVNVLRRFAGLQTSNDATKRTVNFTTLHFLWNPAQLTKLGVLDGNGINALLARSDSAPAFPAGSYSKICRDYPHILCDAQQSLDDPNTVLGPVYGKTALDAERSVTVWFHRNWETALMQQTYVQSTCTCSFTDFILGNSPSRITTLYNNLFIYPNDCQLCFPYAPGSRPPTPSTYQAPSSAAPVTSAAPATSAAPSQPPVQSPSKAAPATSTVLPAPPQPSSTQGTAPTSTQAAPAPATTTQQAAQPTSQPPSQPSSTIVALAPNTNAPPVFAEARAVKASSGGSNSGAIVGAVVGSLVGVGAIAGGAFYYMKHKGAGSFSKFGNGKNDAADDLKGITMAENPLHGASMDV